MGFGAAPGFGTILGDSSSLPAPGMPGRRLFDEVEGIEFMDTGVGWRRITPIMLHRDTSDQSVTGIPAAGRIDVAALEPVTFDVEPGFMVIVRFRMPWNTHALAGGMIRGYIADNAGADAAANLKAQAFSGKAYTTNVEVGALIVEEEILVPGTYSRKPQVGSNSASGAHGALATATSPLAFSIREAPLT